MFHFEIFCTQMLCMGVRLVYIHLVHFYGTWDLFILGVFKQSIPLKTIDVSKPVSELIFNPFRYHIDVRHNPHWKGVVSFACAVCIFT